MVLMGFWASIDGAFNGTVTCYKLNSKFPKSSVQIKKILEFVSSNNTYFKTESVHFPFLNSG